MSLNINYKAPGNGQGNFPRNKKGGKFSARFISIGGN